MSAGVPAYAGALGAIPIPSNSGIGEQFLVPLPENPLPEGRRTECYFQNSNQRRVMWRTAAASRFSHVSMISSAADLFELATSSRPVCPSRATYRSPTVAVCGGRSTDATSALRLFGTNELQALWGAA